MFSITIKRSVVTAGVVAGLLAAAGPASAQGGGADFTRISIGTTEVFELNTFGTLDPVEHRGGNDTRLAAGGAHGLKSDGNEIAVEGLTRAREGRLAPVDDMDLSIRGDDTIAASVA